MDIILIVMAGLILAGTILTFYNMRKVGQGAQPDKETLEKILRLEERISGLNEKSSEMNKMLDTKLSESTTAMREQFGQSSKIVQDVTEKLTKLDETNKQVLGFSEQLNKLQDTLNNPKQRGILGEYYLEETLKNVLPPNSYQMQYKFKDGEIVDAVVFVKEKIIPVDSKFSLENYQRIVDETDNARKEELEKVFKQDLKNRIDETSKYVRPRENTMEFAFMFIPSEAIYYDLLVNKVGAVKVATRDLIEYAFKEKHVIIVSPTSFLAYLQSVLQGLRALQIEESAKEIKKGVGNLSKHIMSYKSYMDKLGIQIGTTVNTYNTAYKEFKKLDKDTNKISGVGGDFDVVEIEKPKEE